MLRLKNTEAPVARSIPLPCPAQRTVEGRGIATRLPATTSPMAATSRGVMASPVMAGDRISSCEVPKRRRIRDDNHQRLKRFLLTVVLVCGTTGNLQFPIELRF